jgi:hypothetical protein
VDGFTNQGIYLLLIANKMLEFMAGTGVATVTVSVLVALGSSPHHPIYKSARGTSIVIIYLFVLKLIKPRPGCDHHFGKIAGPPGLTLYYPLR